MVWEFMLEFNTPTDMLFPCSCVEYREFERSQPMYFQAALRMDPLYAGQRECLNSTRRPCRSRQHIRLPFPLDILRNTLAFLRPCDYAPNIFPGRSVTFAVPRPRGFDLPSPAVQTVLFVGDDLLTSHLDSTQFVGHELVEMDLRAEHVDVENDSIAGCNCDAIVDACESVSCSVSYADPPLSLLVCGDVEANPGPVKYEAPEPKPNSAKPKAKPKPKARPTMTLAPGFSFVVPDFKASKCAGWIARTYVFSQDKDNVFAFMYQDNLKHKNVCFPKTSCTSADALHAKLCPDSAKCDYPKRSSPASTPPTTPRSSPTPPPRRSVSPRARAGPCCVVCTLAISGPRSSCPFGRLVDGEFEANLVACQMHYVCFVQAVAMNGGFHCPCNTYSNQHIWDKLNKSDQKQFPSFAPPPGATPRPQTPPRRAPTPSRARSPHSPTGASPRTSSPPRAATDDEVRRDVAFITACRQYMADRPHIALGIGPSSTDADVKMAYRKAALVFHPDRLSLRSIVVQSHGEKAFKKVGADYDLLKTAALRAGYFATRGRSPPRRTGRAATPPPRHRAGTPPSWAPPRRPAPGPQPAPGPGAASAGAAPPPTPPRRTPVFTAPPPPPVTHIVPPVAMVLPTLWEYSASHRCSLFVWRVVWEFVLSGRYPNSPVAGQPRSRVRLAEMILRQKQFVRNQMARRQLRNLGGVVAAISASSWIPGLHANTGEELEYSVQVMDFSAHEMLEWCALFGVPVNAAVRQAGDVFIECDAHKQHTGVYLSLPEHRACRRIVHGFYGLGSFVDAAGAVRQRIANQASPIRRAMDLVNSLTTSPIMRIRLIVERLERGLRKPMERSVVNPLCPTHSQLYDEGTRLVNTRLFYNEKFAGPSATSSNIKRKGVFGHIKFALGLNDYSAGVFQGPKSCCCVRDPISFMSENYATDHPVRRVLASPEYDAFINSMIATMSGMNYDAVKAYVNTRLSILLAKHPFDNTGVLNQAMEFDPNAQLRLCRDNTLLQVIHDIVQFRVSTLDVKTVTFYDIVLDGKCYACSSTKTRNVNGTDSCAKHDHHRLCPNCFIPHPNGCPLDFQQREPTLCGCGGGGCKRCRIFDTCERCGCVRCTKFRGKKTEKYCPKCAGGVPGILHPMLRTGYGMILHDTIVPTTSFCLPRVQGHKKGSFTDPVTRLTALIDGRWVDIRNTDQLNVTGFNRAPGATLYGLAWSQSLPAVAELDLRSLLHSMVTRQLKDQDGAAPGYFARLDYFVRNNMELLFGPPVKIVPTPFAEWVSRFPPGRQAQLRHALNNVRNARFNLAQACQRTIFGKNEKLEKGSYKSTSADFSCRVISSLAGYEAVVILGPWMHSFGNHLKKVFAQGTCATTACGMDAADLGACFQAASELMQLLDADHSKFDSTIHYRLLELEKFIYEYFGVDDDHKRKRVLKYQLESKFNIKMVVNGRIKTVAKGKYYGRRNSGDPNTTTGNTLLNAVCTIFAAFLASPCSSFEEFYDPAKFRIWIIGDDLMMATAQGHVDFELFMMEHAQSGLKLECNLRHHPSQLTFCGARSVPAIVDGKRSRIAIPQFERWMTKIGWSRDPQPSADAYLRGLVSCWRGAIGQVPLFRDVLDLMERCSRGPAKKFRRNEDGFNERQVRAGRVQVSEATDVDVATGLGVGVELIHLWRNVIQSVPSLPCVVSLPGADTIVA